MPLITLPVFCIINLSAIYSFSYMNMPSSVQFSCSITSESLRHEPWTTALQASLSITNSWSSPKHMSIESVMPSNHPILCRPLLLLPSIFPSNRVFSNESVLCIRWPKYWSFSFNISPSNEHPGLISFRMDWLDLLAVQGTLKSLLQHHSSKASILRHSAFFIVQLSHPYITNGKTIALTRWTFVGKVMSLLFNMLSRLVLTFLLRSKRLFISWLQSPSAVIWEPKKIKSDTVSTVSPSISHEVMGPDAMILVFWMLSFKPTFSLSSFTFIKKLFSSSSLSVVRVLSSACLRLLIFLLAILIPACASSSPAFLMMYSVYKLNKQGDSIQPWRTPFPIWNQSAVPCSNCCFLTCIQISQEADQVVWYSHLFQNFPQFLVIHTVKGFGIVNQAEIDIFWNPLAFLMIQRMLAIWCLVPLSFLKRAWTSGSSCFMYYWSLAWRILSITLLACEMSAIVR